MCDCTIWLTCLPCLLSIMTCTATYLDKSCSPSTLHSVTSSLQHSCSGLSATMVMDWKRVLSDIPISNLP